MSQKDFEKLVERMQRGTDIGGAMALLSWDMHTHMPSRGAGVRAERLATLGAIVHELITAKETGELLARSETYATSQGEGSYEAAVWRELKRQYDKATLIPTELEMEKERAFSLGNQAWMTARANDDYDSYKPFLQKNIDLVKQTMELSRGYYPNVEDDYDILLDDYERGMKASDVAAVFDEFKAGARPLIDKVAAHVGDGRDKAIHSHFPAADQERLARKAAHAVGFTDDAFDLTTTTHPFESSMSINDIRITTRYEEDFFNASFFGTLHEFGHGIYEHQIDEKYERSVLASGVSMAWHESQSRTWENLVGRSEAFWTFAAPMAKDVFPEQFAGMEAADIHRAVNTMGPSFIRVEADELTYNFHIILRFELEREIIAGRLSVDDLPEAWNAKMKEYLGVDVPNNRVGVLQDVHWSFGSFGYFSTYALGNILGAMLWEKVIADMPDLYDDFARGEFGRLRDWQREHIHQHGSLYQAEDLRERVLGTRKLDAQPLLAYLQQKVDALYGE